MSSEKEIFASLQKYLKGCELAEVVNKNILGTLYKVNHPTYGATALKYFEGAVVSTQKFIKKTLNELEQAMEVRHPNAAKVYQVNYPPHAFILREWVEGTSLEEKLLEEPLPPLEATQLLIKTALGVQAAYNFEVRHKNLKPSNIIVTTDDATGKSSVKVVDFLLPPTLPHYISPETLSEKKSDIRSDIYTLGIIYYKMLSGLVPFSGTLNEIIQQHLEAPYVEIPGIVEESKEVLAKCLAKKPQGRYEDLIQLVYALRKARKRLLKGGYGAGLKVQESITFSLPSSEEDLKKITQMALQYGKTASQKEQPVQELLTKMPLDAAMELTEMNPATVGEPSTSPRYETKELGTMVITPDLLTEEPKETAKTIKLVKTEEPQIDIEPLDEDASIAPDYQHLPDDVPEKVKSALLLATDVCNLKQNGKVLSQFSIAALKKFKETVLEYLQAVLRRECWIIKEKADSDMMEIIVDLEMAKTLRYFNFFEDKILAALMKLPQRGSIQKTVITRIESLEECGVVNDKIGNEAVSASGSKNVGMYSMLDTIIKLQEKEEVSLVEEGEEIEEISDPDDIASEVPQTLDINVNFGNPFQTRAWLKLVKEHGWEHGKHFKVKGRGHGLKNLCFSIALLELQDYERKRAGVSKVQEFFQGDYEITRFDHGGMAAVLKLTTKGDTIIFIRPENRWAREQFASYLSIRKRSDGQECVYATVPKGTDFIVKVAFEGREEALVYESRLLSNLSEDPDISKNIIGMVQQGSFLASGEDAAEKQEERLGYYLMMEYAPWGNVEQFSNRFPYRRLPPGIGFIVFYSMVQTLQHLKKKGIIHRDLKPQNILMCANGMPKLCDFGLAITTEQKKSQLDEDRRRLLRLVDNEFLQISNKKEQAQTRIKKLREKLKQLGYPPNPEQFEEVSIHFNEVHRQLEELANQEKARAEGLKTKYRPMSAEEIALKGEFAGSLLYAAPEQFSPSKLLTCACDVYQLGAVSYTLFTGTPPVKGSNINAIMGQIVAGKRPHIANAVPGVPVLERIGDVVCRMMEYDSEKRITIEEVRQKLEEILLDYSQELAIEPYFPPPPNLKSGEEAAQWREKVEYAKRVHDTMASRLRHLLCLALERFAKGEIAPKTSEIQRETLKTVLVSISPELPGQFKFRCPACNRKLQLPANRLNKPLNCPNCQQRMVVKLEEG